VEAAGTLKLAIDVDEAGITTDAVDTAALSAADPA
jgi:hypothetical protein